MHTDHVSKLFALHWVLQYLFNCFIVRIEWLQSLRRLEFVEVLALELFAVLEAVLLHLEAAHHSRLVVEAHLGLEVLEKEAAASL